MDRYTFRLKELRMTDFMSVEYGRISFSDIDKEYDKEDMSLHSSVTGIYGINGSGKTTVVKAVQIFLDAIWIKGNKEAYLNAPSIFRKNNNKGDEDLCLVRNGCDYANLSFTFHVLYDEIPAHKLITYSFSFRMNPDMDIFDETVVVTDSDNRKETVFFSGKFLADREYAESFLNGIVNDDGNEKLKKLVDAHSVLDQKRKKDRLFLYQLISTIGEDSISSVNGRLLVSFRHEMCANLIPFDETLISKIRGKENDVLFLLGYYVSHATGKIMSSWLRVSDGRITSDAPSSPEEQEGLERVVNGINQVVDVILKDTHLVVSQDQENGGYYLKVQKDNGIIVPFCDESYGTSKIIVFTLYLSLLFVRPGMILVIDEFDEGLFEYLLGKILKVIEENAQGQLIFTAHNLRPLEVLPHDCIRFAIPNESNRKNVKNLYRKLKKTNSNSNLREVYYRFQRGNNNLGSEDEFD